MEKRQQFLCIQRVSLCIYNAADTPFSTLKVDFIAIAVFKRAADQQLVIAVEKIVWCLLRKTI